MILVSKCIPGVGVEKREENIESFSAVASLGRMELCKSSTCTRRSARLHRQGQLCHDDICIMIRGLSQKLLVKRVMKQHIAQPMGWMVKNFQLILLDPQNCLIGTMFLGPEIGVRLQFCRAFFWKRHLVRVYEGTIPEW